jgi:hypothetical protein
MITTKAVMDSLPGYAGAGPLAVLARFRLDFHACLTARADELSELAEAAVTAAQVRNVVTRLVEAGHWRAGDPQILVIFDAGYDVARLAFRCAETRQARTGTPARIKKPPARTPP